VLKASAPRNQIAYDPPRDYGRDSEAQRNDSASYETRSISPDSFAGSRCVRESFHSTEIVLDTSPHSLPRHAFANVVQPLGL
jgi:hypothetical protein